MAFVVRRVFYAKVGMAEPLGKHFQQAGKMFNQAGMKTRVYSDYQSGRSDRVAVDFEVETLQGIDQSLAKLAGDQALAKQMQQWEAKMNEMIHYSEAEIWQAR